MQDVISKELVVNTLQILGVGILVVGGIGIVSMRVGFINKSIPATLITALILSAIYGNTAINTTGTLSGLIIGGIGLIATVSVMAELVKRVNKMEVE